MIDGMRDLIIETAYKLNDRLASVMGLDHVLEHAFIRMIDNDTAWVLIDVDDPTQKALLTLHHSG